MERYAGRVAMVTGAGSGMGAAIARALVGQGLRVVGLDTHADRVQDLDVKGAPGKLYALKGDVRSEESILAAFKWIKDNLSGVDILINNAGVLIDIDLLSATTEVWRQQIEVNLLGLSICSREAIQDMLRRRVDDGFIINICSIAAHVPPVAGHTAMYSATKQAVNTLLEGFRKELVSRKSNIRVGQICPALTRTAIFNKATNWNTDVFDKNPCMEPEDIAEAVIFMLSRPPRVQIHDIVIRPTGDTIS